MTGITHIFSIIKWKPTVYVTAGVRSSSWALIGQSMLEINFLSAGHIATFIFARRVSGSESSFVTDLVYAVNNNIVIHSRSRES